MPKFTVLLIDDDVNMADLLSRAAEIVFPEAVFIHATSYSQAVAYLDDLTGPGPQLVLLDIDLQFGPSGLEFLSLLRQHTVGCLLPIVMLSASREETDKREAYQRGATVYTHKPFTYQGWKTYVAKLRSYWYETVTVPKIWFHKEADGQGNL